MNIYWRVGWFVGSVIELFRLILLVFLPKLLIVYPIEILAWVYNISANLISAKYIYMKGNRENRNFKRDYDDFQMAMGIVKSTKEKLGERLTEAEIEALGPELKKYFTDHERKWFKKRIKKFDRLIKVTSPEYKNLKEEKLSSINERIRLVELHLMNPEKFPPLTDKK